MRDTTVIRSVARLTAAVLILASAAAFAIGVAVEHHSEGAEHAAVTATAGTDPDGGHEGADQSRPAEHSELLFGVNPESTGLVVTAVVVSVLFAAAILTIGTPWLAGLIAVLMLAFAALDVREILHQFGESHLGLALLAILVAVLHVLAAAMAVRVTRTAAS
jgi:hypothetical protein